MKVFTKFEDLPAELRKPDSGVKFEDGWITVSMASTQPPWLQTAFVENSSIRAKVRWTGGIYHCNLDGIPEAEALRLLGVDEKGNDLRALAAKQEQQKAQAEQQSAIDAVPELKTLHEQFVKRQAERVSAPFEKVVAALNTSYLGGLDREIEKEKKAGHLDGVLVLEAEKRLINVGRVFNSSGAGENELKTRSTSMPIPAEDDDATPANLKALRKIYRDTFAKHEATRAVNLKLLTDPLSIRLKQLESPLTQKNRIVHAKTVREYREGLGRAAVPAAAANGLTDPKPANPALAGASALPAASALAIKGGFTNSLGMRFVEVPGTKTLFRIHETRRQDYAAYAADKPAVNQEWKLMRRGAACFAEARTITPWSA